MRMSAFVASRNFFAISVAFGFRPSGN